MIELKNMKIEIVSKSLIEKILQEFQDKEHRVFRDQSEARKLIAFSLKRGTEILDDKIKMLTK